MTARFDKNSHIVKVITTFQSVTGSYIRKGHCTCPFRTMRVISWRTSLSGRTSYVFLIRRTQKAGTVVTLTVHTSQNYPDVGSWCAKIILSGTRRIRSVQRGRSHGFEPTCATSHTILEENSCFVPVSYMDPTFLQETWSSYFRGSTQRSWIGVTF